MKQAPRKWNLKIDLVLKGIGIETSPGEPCFYVWKGCGNAIMIIASYVGIYGPHGGWWGHDSNKLDENRTHQKVWDEGPS